MPVVEPLSREAIEGAGLGEALAEAEALGVPDDVFFRVLGHVPGYAEALYDALHRSHAEGDVDHRLKEIIRVRLARQANDPYFAGLRSATAAEAGLDEATIEAGCGDFETDPRFTEAEKWALRYASLMFTAPKRVGKAFYDQGKTHYTEAQIMELGAFIAFHYGMQLFMGTLKGLPVD
jgi:alkylhydroperoxidase family enzyme